MQGVEAWLDNSHVERAQRDIALGTAAVSQCIMRAMAGVGTRVYSEGDNIEGKNSVAPA